MAARNRVNKGRLHKQLQLSTVELVSVVNRICDRHEAEMPVSAGDMGMARRMLQFISDDLDKIVHDSKEITA